MAGSPRFPSSLSLFSRFPHLCWWTFSTNSWTGRDSTTCLFFLPVHGVATCFHFFLLVSLMEGGTDGQTHGWTNRWTGDVVLWLHPPALACRDVQPADLIDPSLKMTYWRRGRGFPGRRAQGSGSTRKKATQPKLTTKLNKQPNMCSKLKDKLQLELPVPFVTPGATIFFYSFWFSFFWKYFCFLFVFSFLELFLLRASQARLSGSR